MKKNQKYSNYNKYQMEIKKKINNSNNYLKINLKKKNVILIQMRKMIKNKMKKLLQTIIDILTFLIF